MITIESTKENPFKLPVAMVFVPRGKESDLGVSIDGDKEGFAFHEGKVVYAIPVSESGPEGFRKYVARAIQVARQYKKESIAVIPPEDSRDCFSSWRKGQVWLLIPSTST